ncbi:MAG: indole-3-glycerol-phosphate synthase TrpC, partial [Chlorobia bacterium]|nr:indole-3-glycerol-phosphate synthase TrpC [Fimbriimonadaceae bacterium]
MFSRLNILERIFATKLEEIEDAKRRVSIGQLKDEATDKRLLPFKNTLANSQHRIALIAEVKKA